MKKLSTSKRKELVLKNLKSRSIVSLKELSNLLNVSEMTIYRDVKFLGKNLFLSKGNVIYKEHYKSEESPYNARRRENRKLKIAIAKTALNYIKNKDTIFLDGSSTIGYLVDEILETNLFLTVVTISPIVSLKLAKKNNYKILCPGGELEKINSIYIGNIDKYLESININKAFISCGAFSIDKGFSDLTTGESNIKRAVFDKIKEVNILIDHTKINNSHTYTWANFDEPARIIVDNEIDKESIKKLKSKGIVMVFGNVTETENSII